MAQLDDGVLAVFGLDDFERVGAVGEERIELPTRQQLALAVEGADAADDQPRPGLAFSLFCANCALLVGEEVVPGASARSGSGICSTVARS